MLLAALSLSFALAQGASPWRQYATPEEAGFSSATLAELGIDDQQSLTEAEKRATVADLLGSRSGVYLPAAKEPADMRAERPARGSHAAGEFFFYNNWDFNVL